MDQPLPPSPRRGGPFAPPVLLVDDYPANLLALAAVLAPMGCRLVFAASGPEALKRMLEEDFALILMDVRMPELDGFATASFMRQRARSSQTPIIFITGADINPAQLSRANGLGVVDYLIKPIDNATLRSRVGTFIELFRKAEQLKQLDEEVRDLEKSRAQALADIQTRQDLLAMVSHDLRTPLAAIGASSESLARHIDDPHDQLIARLQKHLVVTQRAVVRMSTMLSDLLDVSRLEAGRLVVEVARHDIRTVLGQAFELLQAIAVEKNVRLEIEEGSEACAVSCERDRILQVLSNLVGNAMKFTPEGGKISLKCVSIDRQVVVSVRDTGCGIAQDQLPHIFTKYWQAREPGRQGIGLGLAIAKGIVSAHGGAIWAESHLGEGTTMFFSLPVAGERAAVSPGGRATERPSPGERG